MIISHSFHCRHRHENNDYWDMHGSHIADCYLTSGGVGHFEVRILHSMLDVLMCSKKWITHVVQKFSQILGSFTCRKFLMLVNRFVLNLHGVQRYATKSKVPRSLSFCLSRSLGSCVTPESETLSKTTQWVVQIVFARKLWQSLTIPTLHVNISLIITTLGCKNMLFDHSFPPLCMWLWPRSHGNVIVPLLSVLVRKVERWMVAFRRVCFK